MTRVSISELKANLSRYLREVRRGGEVQVLDRGVPVARLTALPGGPVDRGEHLERLIHAGIVTAGGGDMLEALVGLPIQASADLVEAVREDREDRV